MLQLVENSPRSTFRNKEKSKNPLSLVKFFRSWKNACKLEEHEKAKVLANQMVDEISDLVRDRKSLYVNIGFGKDEKSQQLGEELNRHGLLSFFDQRKFDKAKRYYGMIELRIIPGAPDWQAKLEGFKPTASENLVAQFSISTYPCQTSELHINWRNVKSIRYKN